MKINNNIFVTLIIVFIWQTVNALQRKPVDGELASENEFPYIVAIICRLNPTREWKHRCHGSLIHRRWVLTSVYCGGLMRTLPIFGGNCGVSLNRYNVLNPKNESYEEVEDTYFYGDASDSAERAGVALLRLESLVKFAKTKPIRLSRQSYKIGTKLRLITGGKPKTPGDPSNIQLRKKIVTIRQFKNCEQGEASNPTLFCGNARTCPHDIGAPLIIKRPEPKSDILVGYVGWADAIYCTRSFNVLSNVTFYIPFITKILEANKDTLPK